MAVAKKLKRLGPEYYVDLRIQIVCHPERSEGSIELKVAHSRHSYSVYILANKYRGTLYVGVTGVLVRRIWQHKTGVIEGFTRRYGLDRLVYFERFRNVRWAIDRESEIKGWLRGRKIALIESSNPTWRDLSADWYDGAWILRCAQNDK